MTRRIHVSVESIMVILLMILIAISISVLIYNGSLTYRNIIDNKNVEENTRIALSYINMRVKQNDNAGQITVDSQAYEGNNALVITHTGDEEGLFSYIYHYDGFLWECYTDGPLDHSLSTEIIDVETMTIDFDPDLNGVLTTIPVRNNNDTIDMTQLSVLRAEAAR